MRLRSQRGPVNPTVGLLLLGFIVACVWIWKRLPPELQDQIVEQAVPVVAAAAVVLLLVWRIVKRIRRRAHMKQERALLLAQFQKATAPDKRLELACTLVEINDYQLEGLESVADEFQTVFSKTLTTALGDKLYRDRGRAASYLGVLCDPRVVPLMMKALDDDHWWVRSQAALGLGRMRAKEAKAKLEEMAAEDWDQTVRSRCLEALERIK
ncbi:MAG: HEAT repeat domain-containing protein [Nitrospira sp.]